MTHAAHHPDDEAVDRFADELKAKLADARAKGRNGFQPALVIDAPEGVTLKCLQWGGDDD